MLLAKDESRCTNKTVKLTMASQYIEASTAEGQPARAAVGQRTDPLNSLDQETSDVRHYDVLVPVILKRQKFGRNT
jgi:hypothetical protein